MQVYRYFFQGRFRDTTGINDWEHAGIYFDQYPLVWYCVAVVLVCLQRPLPLLTCICVPHVLGNVYAIMNHYGKMEQ